MAKAKEENFVDNSKIYDVVFEDVMHDSMLPYSEYVILDRALPRVEDGLKPVQRRILYSMYEMGLGPEKPFKKSARIVGDCMGKYHPHGDSSIYGAIVNMAQDFSMRMKLIDGHGNFGSVDGDGAAAMRYTEARMSPLAMELLRDIDKNTVTWSNNFDDTLKEPNILPGRFPNLFVNGANGIAVGLATNIPPHNLSEIIEAAIKVIDHPSVKLKDLLQIVKGPDFPTGGYIIPVDSLEEIYSTGRGKIKIRAKVHIEEESNEKKSIVITEIPYKVSKSELLTKIADLREANKDILSGISDIVDESDKDGIRAVIKCKRDTNVDEVVNFLFKKSNLETTFSVNMVAIANGKPETLGLVDYLKYYVFYQRDIIKRRTIYELKIAKARAEIVKGLLIAIANIDEVIKIIKQSASTTAAKLALKERFSLSDEQATAIVEMKLKNLTHLEVDKLEQELKELEEKIKYLTEILNSKQRQFEVVKQELREIGKKQKCPRASVLMGKGQKVNIPIADLNAGPGYKEGVIAVNPYGEIKFLSFRSYGNGARDINTCSDKELVKDVCVVNNTGEVIAFTNFGNYCKINIDEMPEKKWKDSALPLKRVSEYTADGEKVVKVMFIDKLFVGELLFYTKKGMIKRSDLSEYLKLAKDYNQAVVLSDGDEVINVEMVESDKHVLAVTKKGLSLAFRLDDVPVQGRKAGGVRGVKLGDGDEVAFMGQCDDEGEIVVCTTAGNAKRIISSTIEPGNRYLKGSLIADLGTARIAGITLVKMPYDFGVVTEDNVVHVVNTEKVKIDTKSTKGKSIVKGKVKFIVAHKSQYK